MTLGGDAEEHPRLLRDRGVPFYRPGQSGSEFVDVFGLWRHSGVCGGQRSGGGTRYFQSFAESSPADGDSDPAQFIYEVGHAQIEIDKLRGNSPRLFRAPGLAWSSGVAAVLNGDPSTGTIQGPVDADVGAAFQVNLTSAGPTWIGGDWDCFALNLGVAFCGDLYVKAIHQAPPASWCCCTSAPKWMDGRDGNPFILNLTKYIVEHLGPEYEYLPLGRDSGVRGDLMTAPAAKVSDRIYAG